MEAPKYELGHVYDLRFSKEHMPDRIYIKGISTETGKPYWIYQVYSEVHPWKSIYMTEQDIDARVSHKSKECYQHPIVQQMYQRGFRFCGNSAEQTAVNRITLRKLNILLISFSVMLMEICLKDS